MVERVFPNALQHLEDKPLLRESRSSMATPLSEKT